MASQLPERIQLRRTKGWRMPPNTVKVTRPGPWGNPFNFRSSECCWLALSYGCRADPPGRQEASVRAYRQWIYPGDGRRTVSMERGVAFGRGPKAVEVGPRITAGEAPALADIQEALRGKNLACWCAPGTPCHADVLLEIANAPIPGAPQEPPCTKT